MNEKTQQRDFCLLLYIETWRKAQNIHALSLVLSGLILIYSDFNAMFILSTLYTFYHHLNQVHGNL